MRKSASKLSRAIRESNVPSYQFDYELVMPDNKCKTCVSIYQSEHRRYCMKQSSDRTSSGHKIVKANDTACQLFETTKNN